MSDPNPGFQPPPPPTAPPQPERQRLTWLLYAGIGLFVIGIVIAGLSLLKVLPGMTGAGAGVCALGILFFGFSFLRLPAIPDAPPKMSTAGTIGGIFFEPTNVFRNLRAHPRWLAAILIVGIINAAYTAAFYQRLTPERIVSFTYDALEQSPLKPPPEALAESRRSDLETAHSLTGKAARAIGTIVGGFFGVAFVAALCLLGVLAFGGRMHYWQAYAVTAYVALPFAVVQKLVSFLVLYLKAPEDIHPLIGQESLVYDHLGLLVSSKDHPVIFTFLATFGVLVFYRIWLTAVGLREGGYKVSSTAAWGVTITLTVLYLLLRLAMAAIFPSFLG
jgi:hypothetical protein